MNPTRRWASVLALLLSAAQSALFPGALARAGTGGTAPDVTIHGTVHDLMHGDEVPASVTISGALVGTRTFGLGAMAGLHGELTILGGDCWVSRMGEAGVETTSSDGVGLNPALLVTADVDSWSVGTTTREATLAQLAEQVRRLGAAAGIAEDRPLVFRVVGALPQIQGHVIDGRGREPGQSHELRHARAAVGRRFEAQQGVLLGFVSSQHAGVLTHAGESVHAHALLRGDNLTLHVEAVTLPAGTSFELGLRSLTATEWGLQAREQYAHGEFAASAESYAQTIAAGAGNPTTFYNAACSAALAGKAEDALRHLDAALAKGFRGSALLGSDKDLPTIRADARWAPLMARCRKAEADFANSLGAPELREELLEMSRIDQAARRGEHIKELEGRGLDDVDVANTARMQAIVSEHGWPVSSLVGQDGASAAWLLVQHADRDPAFQRHCLELMNRLPPQDVSPVDLAYLTDRVLVNEGKPQVFGTQFWVVDGELVPRPIEDEAGVEARRAAIGMTSMEEYTELMTGRR